MNIFLSYACNRRCPACFASDLMRGRRKRPVHMDLREFRAVVSFLRRSKRTTAGLIGGEPTLHPRFPEAVGMLLDAGITTTLYSNGIMDAAAVSFLKSTPAERVQVILNLGAPAAHTAPEKTALSRCLSGLAPRITPSCIVSSAGQSLSFAAGYIDAFKLRRFILLKYAKPAAHRGNEHVRQPGIAEVSRHIVALCREMRRRDISVGFSCGFARCHFSRRDLGLLRRYGTRFHCSCAPQLDVMPGLEVSYCLPLASRVHRPLASFGSYDGMVRYFSRAVAPYKLLSPFGDCYKCSAFLSGECGSGCAGYAADGACVPS